MTFFAASEAPPRPESMKFPVNSLLAGNLAFSETSSQLTPPSSGESRANPKKHVGDDVGKWHTSSELQEGRAWLLCPIPHSYALREEAWQFPQILFKS